MVKLALRLATILVLPAAPALAQDATFGLTMPVTLGGAAIYTDRPQVADPSSSAVTGGFRGVVYPTLQLGTHWFAYAAVQVDYTPYFYYDTYYPEHDWYLDSLQAFVGYVARTQDATWVFKAGRLSSAFGAFPLHYDDADNPLIDQPLSYSQTLTLRHDQIPCGVNDLLAQRYGWIRNWCGGVQDWDDGITPVTLYGLPGVQAEFSGHRVDARFQVTSGSPANPLSLGHTTEFAQWAAGGGYTILQGFRVGVSGFRGPYLDPFLAAWLPAGTTVRNFPASAIGADAQWARGHWSLSGEWQRFQFDSPNFTTAPSVISSYLEVKRVLTPRFYIAGRAGWLHAGRAVDKGGTTTNEFAPGVGSYELAGGWWLNRYQLIKAGYEWVRSEYAPGTRDNVLGIELVTTFRAVDRVFR